MLTSCYSKDYSIPYDIETYDCDMSLYEEVNEKDNCFKQTSVEQLEKLIEEKGYGIFVFSRTSCSHCQIVMKYIDEIASDMGLTVFYIDALSEEHPVLGTSNFDFLMDYLNDYLKSGEDGPELQTPHVFTIMDGEIKDSKVGTTWNGLDYSDDDIESLKQLYIEMFKPFASKNQD